MKVERPCECILCGSLLIDGTIRWVDVQLPCTFRAVKVSIPKLDVWEYVKTDVAQAPTGSLADPGFQPWLS
jgi:hypothetical protein